MVDPFYITINTITLNVNGINTVVTGLSEQIKKNTQLCAVYKDIHAEWLKINAWIKINHVNSKHKKGRVIYLI